MPIDELIARGRVGYAYVLSTMRAGDRPIGGGQMRIVLYSDFIDHAAVCLDYVRASRQSLYILDETGDLSTLVAPFTWRR